MYQKFAVQFEQLFNSAGNIVNKMLSSLEANTVNILMCLPSWLSVDISVRKRLCYYCF